MDCKKRESEGSTGMENGIAIPHVKSDAIQQAKLMVVQLAEGIDWPAMDGKPTDFVISILVPDGSSNEHLDILSALSRKLMNQEFIDQLKASQSEAEIKELLLGGVKKMKNLDKLMNDQGIISALAIDQRGALRRMMGDDISGEQISDFKQLVSEKLTPYASSILLDPEYGLAAAKKRDTNCGLILAYEQTGYDKQEPGRSGFNSKLLREKSESRRR